MASSSAGAVNSLRAMFEAKDLSSSPPSRGRSPSGLSDIHSIRSTSSRPVSKIRTSFVAVEKSGQMGGTILGLRRVSDAEETAQNGQSSRPAISRSHSNTIEDGIVEEKETEKEDVSKEIITKDVTQDLKAGKLPVNGSKTTAEASAGPNPKLGAVKKASAQTTASTKTPTSRKSATSIDTSKSQAAKVPAPGSAKKQPSTPREVSERKVAVKKPASIETKPSLNGLRTATNAKPKASTTNPRTPTSATKPAVKREAVAKTESRLNTPRTSLPGAKENKPVKNGPKSPTKPGRLPAAAMAATASSAAKTTSDRPSSRSSAKPRTSTDSDFLARMMRPTASSASKIHDKVPTRSSPKTTPQKTAVSKTKRISDGAGKPGTGKKIDDVTPNLDDIPLCTYPGNIDAEFDTEVLGQDQSDSPKVTSSHPVESALTNKEEPHATASPTEAASNPHADSTTPDEAAAKLAEDMIPLTHEEPTLKANDDTVEPTDTPKDVVPKPVEDVVSSEPDHEETGLVANGEAIEFTDATKDTPKELHIPSPKHESPSELITESTLSAPKSEALETNGSV